MEAMGSNSNSEQVNTVVDVKGGMYVCMEVQVVRGRTVLIVVEDHLARDRRCPARGRKFDQCGEIGHFKVRCRKRSS